MLIRQTVSRSGCVQAQITHRFLRQTIGDGEAPGEYVAAGENLGREVT
jgi:hypothetical protein